ncbi:MAG: XRE family transcriptional regulator, partial [Pseudomonadota bacterium]|nr:XRE family transcriptional regulator [Pseudomonadota bacterium]
EGLVAAWLTEHIEACPISQTDIAARLGYARPNIVSMWKSGATRLPFEMIEPLCRVISHERPEELMVLAVREYAPALASMLERHCGRFEETA